MSSARKLTEETTLPEVAMTVAEFLDWSPADDMPGCRWELRDGIPTMMNRPGTGPGAGHSPADGAS